MGRKRGDSGDTDFFGVVEYHDKILAIGYEQDETAFVGFILRLGQGDDAYYRPFPYIEDIEILGSSITHPELMEVGK